MKKPTEVGLVASGSRTHIQFHLLDPSYQLNDGVSVEVRGDYGLVFSELQGCDTQSTVDYSKGFAVKAKSTYSCKNRLVKEISPRG